MIAGGSYFLYSVTPADQDTGTLPGDTASLAIVETYVRAHISELSPTPAVLGGTWYVTDISLSTATGTVHYEDGHIALVADFSFAVSDEAAVSILSFVAREAAPPPTAQSGVRGTVLLGPTCPVMRDPPDPECADKPYGTRLVITAADSVRVVREVESDASGSFAVPLPRGTYTIRSAAAANTLPYCQSEPFTVTTGFVNVIVNCDTGIR